MNTQRANDRCGSYRAHSGLAMIYHAYSQGVALGFIIAAFQAARQA
jgi:hypothetical protein